MSDSAVWFDDRTCKLLLARRSYLIKHIETQLNDDDDGWMMMNLFRSLNSLIYLYEKSAPLTASKHGICCERIEMKVIPILFNIQYSIVYLF